MPKISVCVPAHNSEIWFAQAIESIEAQTFKDWEILVYDDASEDGIEILYDHFREKHGKKFQVFYGEKNMGIAHARNYLASFAEGEIICVQDADDMSQKDRLKTVWDYFRRKKGVDLVYGGFQIIDCLDKPTRELLGKPFDFKELCKHNYIAHGSVAYRKKSFDKVKYREECSVIDDWFLYYDFVKAGMKIGWVEDVLCFHRELKTGVSLSPAKREKIIAMKEKFLKEANADLSVMAD
jgi:glycosyltransferase involved in cell wall biosynthesis